MTRLVCLIAACVQPQWRLPRRAPDRRPPPAPCAARCVCQALPWLQEWQIVLVMFVCVVPTCLLRSTTACVFRTAMQFGTLARPPQRPSTFRPSFASVSRSVLASMV